MVVGAGACWLLPGVDDVAMFAWYVGCVAVVLVVPLARWWPVAGGGGGVVRWVAFLFVAFMYYKFQPAKYYKIGLFRPTLFVISLGHTPSRLAWESLLVFFLAF